MGNVIKKIVKAKDEETPPPPWSDLEQDLVGYILGKLSDPVDVIRFRAVCKNWRHAYIPKDRMIKHENLLWHCHIEWVGGKLLKCKIFDQNTRQKFKTTKHVSQHNGLDYDLRAMRHFGSDGGWLIAGSPRKHNREKWKIFMYNPYINEFLELPRINYRPWCATISCITTRRVFVLAFKLVYAGRFENYIAINEWMNGWRMEFVGATQVECCGMKYINEQLFCLFGDGILRRYGLADGSWTSLDLGEGSYRLGGPNKGLWLVNTVGDSLVSCEFDLDSDDELISDFDFDWSSMSWMRSDTLVMPLFGYPDFVPKEFFYIQPPRID